MAAFSTGTAATTDAFFLALQTLMTANGWTVISTISNVVNNRDIVYRGAALDATAQNYIYLRLTWDGTYWSTRTYADWDTGTNTGSKGAGALSQSALALSSSSYWIRVNEYAIACCVKISATYYKMYGGYARRGLPNSKNGLTRTTAGYAAGVTSMNVASDMTTRLKVGQKVVIYNNSHSSASANFSNAELAIISSITSGAITFSGPTAYAYDSGAVIGWNPNPAIVSYWDSSESLSSAGCYATMLHDAYWASLTSQPVSIAPVILTNETYTDPDEISLEYMGGIVSAYFTSSGKGGFVGFLYHWEAVAGGAQTKEDTMSDGTNAFTVLVVATTFCIMLGPQ